MTFTKGQLDAMVRDAEMHGRYPSALDNPDITAHVKALAAEVTRLTESEDKWRTAFYNESHRATNHHNANAMCGHPASCIRNVPDHGARCLMCLQAEQITLLRCAIETLRRFADNTHDCWEAERDTTVLGERLMALSGYSPNYDADVTAALQLKGTT